MTAPWAYYIAKARKVLETARNLVDDGYFSCGAREAYLAAFHAAQAYIFDHTGRAAKTHKGVQSQFAQLAAQEPLIEEEFRRFLPQAYNMKTIADYELGPEAEISAPVASAAVDMAERFVHCIEALLEQRAEEFQPPEPGAR